MLKFALAGLLLLLPCVAAAQISPPPLASAPAARETPTPGETGTGAEPADGLWERPNLFGALGGLRPALGQYGLSLGLEETDEVLGNPTGGRKQGAIYEGLTQMSLGVDLGRAIGLPGGVLNIMASQIHGRGLAANNIDSLNDISEIEADRSARVYELWYQQKFLAGRLDARVGLLAADEEFVISQYAGLFVNAGFGWPTVTSIDLPAGGPAYPLSTPAIRFRAHPDERTTLLLGVFNGDPAPGTGDPPLLNPTGANLRFQGVLVIAEARFAINQAADAKGLPGTYKIGLWHDSEGAIDPALAVGGDLGSSSLPSVGPTGGFYAVMDQLVWRPAGAKDGGVGAFLRALGAPPDRNQVVASVIGGVTLKGLPGRPDDTLGLGIGWARIGGGAIAGDQARAAATGGAYPVRGAETVIELTYQTQITPWWQLQPDFQYIVRPGGGIPNPDGSGDLVGNAAVLGLRSVVTF